MSADAPQIDARFQTGHSAHQSGDLDAACAAFEAVLAEDPQHAPALNSLGNVQLRRGYLEQAELLIRRAIKVDQQGLGYHTSLGRVLVARGLYDEAQAAFEAELTLHPEFASAHNQLGKLAELQDRPEDAVRHFRAAVAHAPASPRALGNLGRSLQRTGAVAEAEAAYRAALELDKTFAPAHAGLGEVLRLAGDLDAAAQQLEKALAHDRSLATAHRGLAHIALAQARSKDAVEHLERAAQCDPAHAATHALLAQTYFSSGMPRRADRAFRKALALRPRDADLLNDAAAVSRALDDPKTARERYKAALSVRATHQEALAGLAVLMAERGEAKAAAARLAPTVNAGRATPLLLASYARILGFLGRRREGIALLEAAMQRRLDKRIATQLHFALAELLNGEGSYDLAFFHARRANEARTTTFDPAAFRAHINAIMDTFAAPAAVLPHSDWHEPAVVVVVGLPRSGVTVVGRLLAGHPSLHVLGSSPLVENSVLALWEESGLDWPAIPQGFTAQDSARLAHQCMSGRLPPDATRPLAVDTTWRNFFYIGVLASLYPGLRIIECTRDARDIARSCYFQDLSTVRGLPFSYNLTHIGAYVNGYRRLMDHWRRWPGLSVYRLNYERLVLDPARECRLLSDYLGLEHNDAHFALATAGGADAWHVHAKALRRFRHYRAHLETFVDALDAPPDA